MGWTQAEVKEAVRDGRITLKHRPCPIDKELVEVYVSRDNRVVFIGTSDEATKYCTEILFGEGGAVPPMEKCL